jgi:hypothetical protein
MEKISRRWTLTIQGKYERPRKDNAAVPLINKIHFNNDILTCFVECRRYQVTAKLNAVGCHAIQQHRAGNRIHGNVQLAVA